MKNRIVLAVVVLAVVGAAYWYFGSRRAESTAVALLERYGEAEKRSNIAVEQAFALVDVTIDGESRRSIFMHPTSRLTFKAITVPRDAWLRVWVALRPDVWERKEGDGVLFRIGVSDGRTYDELVRQHVDPQSNANDRRWVPLTVDLSAYGGLTVDLVFNTNSSLPGRGDNPANDWAVWGAPEVYVEY
jgi:hypothetical protein